jgi:hypothetical protein
MVWAATAVAGATLVSGYMSSRSADKASDRASEASDQALALEYEKYDEWNATYGDLQDNLVSYYENVSPDYYAAVGVEKFNEEFQTGMQRINENFAQRGIDPNSALAASTTAQSEISAAETRAGIRRDAPRQAREDQRSFLQIGLGQNPGSSLSNALASDATNKANQANSAQGAAGDAWAAAIPAVGNAITAHNTPAPTT